MWVTTKRYGFALSLRLAASALFKATRMTQPSTHNCPPSAITFGAAAAGTTMLIETRETTAAGCLFRRPQRRAQVDFDDVPPSIGFRPFVANLAGNAVTGGCAAGRYCPDSPTLRNQMSVFLLVSKLGVTYTPPPALPRSVICGS